MEALPPRPQPSVRVGAAPDTSHPTERHLDGTGGHQLRLRIQGVHENDPRFHIAVRVVPNITIKTLSFKTLGQRMAAMWEWIHAPTETMQIPDEKNPGKQLTVQVNLNSVAKRVHVSKDDMRRAIETAKQPFKEGLHKSATTFKEWMQARADTQKRVEQATTNAILTKIQEGMTKRLEDHPVDDYINISFQRGENGALSDALGRGVGFTEGQLTEGANRARLADIPENSAVKIQMRGSNRELIAVQRKAGTPREVYLLPKEIDPYGNNFDLRNLLNPEIHCNVTIPAIVNPGERPASDIPFQIQELPSRRWAYIGLSRVARADTEMSPQQVREAVSTGLVDTLTQVRDQYAQDNGVLVYRRPEIQREDVIRQPNGQWALTRKLTDRLPGDLPNHEIRSLGLIWLNVILQDQKLQGDPRVYIQSPAFKERLKEIGFSEDQQQNLKQLLIDMIEGKLAAQAACDRAKEVFKPVR